MRIKHTNDSLDVVYFAERYQGWHSFTSNKRTRKAVERAVYLGSIEINSFNQFRQAEGAAKEREGKA